MAWSELILASTSAARRALMDSLKLPYRAVSPDVEEALPAGTPVDVAVQRLAERKAAAVLARFPDALVIGSDQLVSLDGEALGKPPDVEAARQQLGRMLGREHRILTGLAVLGRGFRRVELDVTTLALYPLSADELERYLRLEEWRGCAGSYRVEEAGQALFSKLEGDRTGVQGLPLIRLVRCLREAGVTFFPSPGV